MATINMQTMRYINLLDKASRVKTKQCFVYNNIIFFAVPKALVSKAIGPNAENIRRLQEHLGKRVRIISEPTGIEDASRFVQDLVAPAKFKSGEVKEGYFVITAGNNQNKALLIGRHKKRLFELQLIMRDIFGIETKIF